MVADLWPRPDGPPGRGADGAAIAGVPVLDRRFIVETLTGRTPLGGLTPNEFGALLPSRQYLDRAPRIELLLDLL
jgi:hypothetical protein